MAYDREFIRRKAGIRLTYQFGPDEMTYTFKDRTGERQFSVRYDAITVLAPYKLTLKDHTISALVGLTAFPLLAVAAWLKFGVLASIFGLLGLGALCGSLAMRAFMPGALKHTMLQMSPAPPGAGKLHLRVMEGGNHDEILAELKSRWRDQLRRGHLAVNPKNDPKFEAEKFETLKQWDVISPEECEAALRQIGQGVDAPKPEPATAGALLN